MVARHLLQRRNGEANDHGDRQPPENDGHRQPADHSRRERTRGMLVTEVVAGHVPLTRQYVNAFTSFEILSALTRPSTKIRQPILALSPCTTTLPTTAGLFAVICMDHN